MSIQKTVRNSRIRVAITILVSTLCLSAVLFATNASAQGNITRKVDVRAGQSCSKKFASTETKFMCLPLAKGTKLVWQKYPAAGGSCKRSGLYARPVRLYCRKYSPGFARAYAKLYWIEAPGPFRYFTIYGNSWEPKRGRECALHNAIFEWQLFQSQWQGEASCLPDATGTVWRWQQKAELNKSCARLGNQWGNLVCARSGARLLWKKAGKQSRTAEEVISEARALFGYLSSIGFKRFTNQYVTYYGDSMENFASGNGVSGGIISEFQSRAALSGVSVGFPRISYEPEMIVLKWSTGQRCFALRDKSLYLEEEVDLGMMYNGSATEVPEVACDRSKATVIARAKDRVAAIDAELWRTNDIVAWHAAVLALGSDQDLALLEWRWTSRSSIFIDDELDGSSRIGVDANVTVNRTVSPAVPTATTYKIAGTCLAGAFTGSSSTVREVSCA